MRSDALLALACAFALSGCDYFAASTGGEERADALYRAAMADYTAGRVDAAVEGFENVVRVNPANASARFQLASLLQDRKRDYLAAICHYREYLLERPDSDKAALARERAALCERLFAAELEKRARPGGATAEEVRGLRAECEKSAGEAKRLAAELEKSERALAAARGECARLRKMVSSIGGDEQTERPQVPSARELLDEEEEETTDRIRLSADVKNLIAEESLETVSTPFAVSGGDRPSSSGDGVAAEPPHEQRPESYVVAEGDTLYKIAIRFYGRRSAWTKIRDANKAVISMDGRVNAGERIVLPK